MTEEAAQKRAAAIEKAAANPLPKDRPNVRTLLGASREDVHKQIGTPSETDERDDTFELGSVTVVPHYRFNKVARMLIMSEHHDSQSLAQWLGITTEPIVVEKTSYEIRNEDSSGVGAIWLNSTALPRRRIEVEKILAQPGKKVERYLGPPEAQNTWFFRDDGLVINVYDGNKNTGPSRMLSISFDEGVYPSQRESEIRQWLSLPETGSMFHIGKKCFEIAVDKISISLDRRFLCED